jgi:hypothetical protein
MVTIAIAVPASLLVAQHVEGWKMKLPRTMRYGDGVLVHSPTTIQSEKEHGHGVRDGELFHLDVVLGVES